MAALRKFADLDHEPGGQAWRPSPPASLAQDDARPVPSPARRLQAELQRALSPQPARADEWCARRAMRFIGPTGAGLWVLIALFNHALRH